MRRDCLGGHLGPLAGVLTAMQWSKHCHPKAVHVLTAPCDTPFLPADLVVRLTGALEEQGADIAIARCPERTHPIIALWPVDLAERLAHDLTQSDVRSVHRWLSGFRVAEALFPAAPLANLNNPEELAAARRTA